MKKLSLQKSKVTFDNKEWIYNNYGIGIQINEKSISIRNDVQLQAFLKAEPNGCIKLIKEIKKQYLIYYQTPFDIQDKSLALEIIGQVFVEDLIHIVKKRFIIKSLKKQIHIFIDAIDVGADIIECGYKDNDILRTICDELGHEPIYSIIMFFNKWIRAL